MCYVMYQWGKRTEQDLYPGTPLKLSWVPFSLVDENAHSAKASETYLSKNPAQSLPHWTICTLTDFEIRLLNAVFNYSVTSHGCFWSFEQCNQWVILGASLIALEHSSCALVLSYECYKYLVIFYYLTRITVYIFFPTCTFYKQPLFLWYFEIQ